MAEDDVKTNDPLVIAKMLRMIADGTNLEPGVEHKVVLRVAADLLETLAAAECARENEFESQRHRD